MQWNSEQENLFKRYLLGEASADEQQQVEESVLRSDTAADWLSQLEEELIDDYARGLLTPPERARFEQYFLATPKRRNKLATAQALVSYAQRSREGAESTAPVETDAEPRNRESGKDTVQVQPEKRSATHWWHGWFEPWWKVAVYAVLVLGVGIGFWRWWSAPSSLEQGLLALNQTYREQRPLKSRITGMDYAPFPETRGPVPERVDLVARQRAERLLFDTEAALHSSAAHHALGQLFLAEGQFEPAIAEFEAALRDAPNNPRLHSDLGTALLEKSNLEATQNQTGRDPRTFEGSLTHLNRALELDEKLLEARFNRALLRQSMGLLPQAKEDWERYLQLDSTSPWAAEAREKLKNIEEQTKKVAQREEQLYQDFWRAYQAGETETAWQCFRQSYFRNGNYLTETLADEWLELKRRNDLKAAYSKLQVLGFLAALAERRTGDRYVTEQVRYYRSLPSSQVPTVIEARALMKTAYRNFYRSDQTAAVAAYTRAQNLFARVGDKGEQLFASCWNDYCRVWQGESDEVLPSLSKVIDQCEVHNYKWLDALALTVLTNSQSRQEEYSEAIKSCWRSYQLAEELSDDNGKLRSLNNLADLNRSLGKFRESLRIAQQGIDLALRGDAESSQMIGFYATSAWDFRLLGLYTAALEYQQEALRLGGEMTSPPLIMSRYYVQLGLIFERLKNYDGALKYMKLGLAAAQSVSTEESKQEMTAYALVYLAHVYRLSGKPVEALGALEQAAIQVQQKKEASLFHDVAREKLLARAAHGDTAAAMTELEQLIELYEKFRARIREESNRNSYFEQEQDIYDVAVELAGVRLNQKARAFNYAETGRARALLDEITGGQKTEMAADSPELRLLNVGRSLTLAEIQQRMPEEVQILQYAVLDDKLVIWWVTTHGFEQKTVPVTLLHLTELVTGLVHQLDHRPVGKDEKWMPAAMELYSVLIQPMAEQLDKLGKDKQLCIVPNKVLSLLPYAVLLGPTTKRFLVEDQQLLYASSSTLFVLASEAAKRKASFTPEHILCVGNPSFNHRAFPKLVDLSAAEVEAETVAKLYDSYSLLLNEQAKKDAVMRALEHAEVIHLAMHHIADPISPLRSKFLLAAESQSGAEQVPETELLTAREIYQLNLARARLVVLSACETQADSYFNSEGPIGITRAFEAAGAPLVVASLWAVDSYATKSLMVNFHHLHRQQKLPTAAALSEAQLAMLQDAASNYRHPYYWASFVAVGGYSDF